MSKRNKRSKSAVIVGVGQVQARGAAKIVGVSIAMVLLLVAGVFGYLALSQKSEPKLVVDTTKVSADDLLTSGKSTNELTTDYRIVAAGLERDVEQRDAAKAMLDDAALPVGEDITASTTVETARLSQLQTDFIKETDRRIKKLEEVTAKAEKLTAEQKTMSLKYITDETTALTGLKARAASVTTKDAFMKIRDELSGEYANYRMVAAQVYLLLWANDQRVLVEKANVLGGKLQERLNEASNHGTSIADAQRLLNGYQTNKQTAKDTNETALKLLVKIRPNTFEANKAVLQGHLNSLGSAHDELKKTSDASKEIILAIQKY